MTRMLYIDTRRIDPDGLQLDEEVPLDNLTSGSGGAVSVARARLQGRAVPDTGAVHLAARLEGRLGLECSRCLDTFETPLQLEFELLLVNGPVESPTGVVEVDEAQALLFPTEDGRAELAAIAREQIYLNLPLKPLCRADCRGLCQTCGGNRNRIECGCPSEPPDPRLAPLLELKGRLRRS